MSTPPTVPAGSNLYSQGYGATSSNSINSAIKASRAPATSDVRGPSGNYPVGQRWVDQVSNSSYTLTSFTASSGTITATWVLDGGGSGALATLTGDTGTATPTAGNIQIAGGAGVVTSASGSVITIDLDGGGTAFDSFTPDAGTSPVVPSATGSATIAGTANQITTTGGLNSLTFSVPATFIAPGSIASTTTLTGGTGVTATTGNILASAGDIITTRSAAGADVTVEATNSDNTNGASRAGVEIATGGASSGDPYLSFQISGVGASTMTMGLDNSASDLFVISNSAAIGTSNALTLTQAGALGATTSITAGTTVTATLGDITATNGNFVGSTAGTGLLFNSPAASGAAASPVVVNGRSGQATFTSVSIAAAADLTLTITNSAITGATTQVLYSMSGATTGSALSIKSVTNSAGSSAIVVTNGTGATTSTADIVMNFLVMNA